MALLYILHHLVLEITVLKKQYYYLVLPHPIFQCNSEKLSQSVRASVAAEGYKANFLILTSVLLPQQAFPVASLSL